MKKILASIFILLLLIPNFTSADEPTDEQQRIGAIERAVNATVKINIITHSSAAGNGSGFFYAPNKVLTNAHVVMAPGITGLTIEKSDGTQCIAKVGSIDEGADLAVVETNCTAEPLGIADYAEVGQDVYVIGSSVLNFAVTTGIIAKLSEKGHIVANVFASKGNSGGAMINSDGEVIGVVRGNDGPEYFIYGIPIKYINAFLKRAGV